MNRLLLLTIVAASLTGCGVNKGRMIGSGSFYGENDHAYQATKNDFLKWIRAQGFKEIPNPGGMSDWVGYKTEGQEDHWYIKLEESEVPYRMRVTLRDDRNTFDTELKYGIDGTKEQWERLQQRVREFHKDIVIWFSEREEKNMLEGGAAATLEVWEKRPTS